MDFKRDATALEFSNDNLYIAAGSLDGEIVLLRAHDLKVIHTLPDSHKDKIISIKFGTNQDTIYSMSKDGYLNVWETQKKNSFTLLKSSFIEVSRMAISDNQKQFAVSSNLDIEIWENSKFCKKIHTFTQAHNHKIKCLFFANNDRNLCSGSETIKVWDLKTTELVDKYNLSNHGYVTDIIFDTKKTQFVVGTDSGRVIFFSI